MTTIENIEKLITDFIRNKVELTSLYYATDVDEVVAASKYYGFLDKNGNWYIMKAAGTGPVTYRYITSAALGNNTDYPTAWTNRATLAYVYPNLVDFK